MLYDALRQTASLLARSLCRPTIEGRENVPATGPVLLASNHLSFVDSVVIPLSVTQRRVRFLAKSDYFEGKGVKGRVTGTVFSALGAMPLERANARDAMATLEMMLDRLRDGEACVIYPEGTRSRDGRLYRGRTGVAHLALESKAPVVPVALSGTQEVQPVGASMPRPRPFTVRFGEPMDFSTGYDHLAPGKARRVITDRVMDAIHALSGQERAGHYNDPGGR
ncbi:MULTISPECIES: lysophospholipid acyltransferase family protein [Nocardiopsis]|uniref:Lysophospholipid acyltransferase family protein n=1 Tax=Nocardiopsis lambiniae TaxID=3075539 RepID=A0ABU2MF67_9ACTN|nr:MULTISPECIES: lysophospholipid acyltransferase family protein [unclassified Nocardiopsis]MDE3722882.1 lysophospholipid acyltransferase family protein [Nocardiopsis sp. N85]MDT0331243.1 lysophospholipid acyltransferase family protein [Nocardiopsis sp. DSM 44743]